MEKFFDLKIVGSILLVVLVLYAVSYFTKPAATPVTTTPAATS